jgi:hypothetical protein
MAIWRDPLDELIADLERSIPVPPAATFDLGPPFEDYSVAVQSIISRDPAERERLSGHPAVQRVMEYLERVSRTWQSSGPVQPQP